MFLFILNLRLRELLLKPVKNLKFTNMGFDEIYRHKKKYTEHYRDNQYYDDYTEHYPHNMPGREHYLMFIINKIWSNRKLRLLFVIFVLIVVILIIIAVIMIIPLIFKVLNAVTQSGLKGIAESITGFIDKIWNGSAK